MPRAVRAYRVFCAVMVVLNLAVTILLVLAPAEWVVFNAINLSALRWLLAAFGLLLTVMNAALLVPTRSPLMYGLHVANLAMSASSCLWLAWAGPLLVKFREPEVQLYYGIQPHS